MTKLNDWQLTALTEAVIHYWDGSTVPGAADLVALISGANTITINKLARPRKPAGRSALAPAATVADERAKRDEPSQRIARGQAESSAASHARRIGCGWGSNY